MRTKLLAIAIFLFCGIESNAQSAQAKIPSQVTVDKNTSVSSSIWKQVSGPANVAIPIVSSDTLVVTFTVAGTYVFSYTVTDKQNNSGSATGTVIVDPYQYTGPKVIISPASQEIQLK